MALNERPARRPFSAKTAQALNLIARNLENPDLGTAALACGVSCAPGYLSGLFHMETGVTPLQHIHRARMRKAEELLARSKVSIKEVAAACGFNSPDYFGRLFRRVHGAPASRYRVTIRRP